MKTKLIYTLAAALVALAPAVRANWNVSSTNAIAIAVSAPNITSAVVGVFGKASSVMGN